MKLVELHVLGLLVLIGAITIIVGAFSPCWILDDNFGCIGTVFYTDYGYWLVLAMWLMIGSILSYGLICYNFYKARYEIRKNGYYRKTGHWFKVISVSSLVIILFISGAVIITAVNPQTDEDVSKGMLGYSAWISVGSSVISAGILFMSTLILYKKCHGASPIVHFGPVPGAPLQTIPGVTILQNAPVQTIIPGVIPNAPGQVMAPGVVASTPIQPATGATAIGVPQQPVYVDNVVSTPILS